MADHSKPTLSSTYSNFVTEVKGRLEDISRQFDPVSGASSNLATGTIRWTSAAKKWELWNGTAWTSLATEYAISISGSAAKLKTARSIALSGGATAAAVSFDGSANITLEVTGLNPTQLSTAVPVSKGGTGASDAVQARANLGLGSAATTSASDYAATNHTHAWGEVTGKPTAFPPASHAHAWGEIAGKPATFPPIVGTASNQAKAGNWVPSWNEVTGKPAIPPTPQSIQSGAVGSYCRLTIPTWKGSGDSLAVNNNGTTAGSNLIWSDLSPNQSQSAAPLGTWRNMSGNRAYASRVAPSAPCTWLRIS